MQYADKTFRNIKETGKLRYAARVFGRKYVLLLSLALLSIPTLIIALCDYTLNFSITWSGYAIGGFVVALSFVAAPIVFRSFNTRGCIITDAIIAFFVLFCLVRGGLLTLNVLYFLVLPLLLSAFIFVLILILILKAKRLSFMKKLALVCVALSATLLPMEICLRKYLYAQTNLTLSFGIISVLVVITFIAFVFNGTRK